jgi:hypothetical protein
MRPQVLTACAPRLFPRQPRPLRHLSGAMGNGRNLEAAICLDRARCRSGIQVRPGNRSRGTPEHLGCLAETHSFNLPPLQALLGTVARDLHSLGSCRLKCNKGAQQKCLGR